MQFINLFENDFYALFPELFLTCAALLLLVFGVIWSTSKASGYPILVHTVAWLSVWSIFCALGLTLHMPFSIMVCFYNTFVIDELTFLLKVMVLCSTGAALLMSMDYLKTSSLNVFEYSILVLLSCISMLLLVSSYDFISMYLAIEMQSLCFYVLAASKRNSEFSTEAGLKYFLLGAFSSGILLFGCSLVYGSTGITNFEDLAKCFAGISHTDPSLVHVGMCLLSIGFLFKLTAAPFHFWAPDVYEGAPTSVTAFFAMTPKIALLGVFIRLLLCSFYDFLFAWQYVLFFCSAASLLIGSFGALAQKKIKRLLVYSSIGHVGYLLMGLCCGTVEGLHAVLLYLVLYVIMTVNIFAIILSSIDHAKTSRVKYIQDLGFLGQTHPVLAVTLSATLFSMAGIPPLAGFCSKFYLFFAAMSSSLYSLAILGVLTSVVSCFYYIRLIKIMYFEQPSHVNTFSAMDQEKATLIGLTSVFIVFFFLCPQSLFLWTYKVAYAFLG
jgi:proton-translocating NADH-quinone oxidoreductase chain N|tara:strand:+ start:7238 stop:8725 length:1488 start_codon:yes stop_codon:yes gene_type:complete